LKGIRGCLDLYKYRDWYYFHLDDKKERKWMTRLDFFVVVEKKTILGCLWDCIL
jgi:folate-binding Fe-S cluster repair protein YgfZ